MPLFNEAVVPSRPTQVATGPRPSIVSHGLEHQTLTFISLLSSYSEITIRFDFVVRATMESYFAAMETSMIAWLVSLLTASVLEYLFNARIMLHERIKLYICLQLLVCCTQTLHSTQPTSQSPTCSPSYPA